MKKLVFKLSVLASMLVSTASFAQTDVKIVTGESVENIILKVDKLLKDSLNPNIQFNPDFALEANRWLDLKISGAEKTGQVGTAHMYSRIIADEGLYLELILQGVNKNIEKINSGNPNYQVGTNLSGLPDSYYAMAVQRDGISYFVYCFD
jgi:hypothetical protein